MRREQLLNVEMSNVIGSDWLVIAAMSFMGKVKTLPSIRVNRGLGGSTVSYTKIAKTLGVSKFQAVFPHAVIAFCAFREIAWRDPVYTLNRVDRVRLAWKCQRIIRLRYDASFMSLFRRGFRLGRHSIKKRVIGSATE
jgi:hypothetical protein